MSVCSKRARRVKRRAMRAAWQAIARNGAMVAPDVWERLVAKLGPAEPGPGPLFGIPIRVEPMLRPGTVMPIPTLVARRLSWPPGTHTNHPSGVVGFWPKLDI